MVTAARKLLERVYAEVGGPSELARLLGIHRNSIRIWTQVPHFRVLRVEAVTGIPRHELRPDLYPQVAGYEPPLSAAERRAVVAARRAELAREREANGHPRPSWEPQTKLVIVEPKKSATRRQGEHKENGAAKPKAKAAPAPAAKARPPVNSHATVQRVPSKPLAGGRRR